MMITLDDRLHDAGDDLRHAAALVPARRQPQRRRPFRRVAGWAGAAAVISVLIALPLWLGVWAPPDERLPVGNGPTTVVDPNALTDAEFVELTGQTEAGPFFVPGSARLIASTEQDGFGRLTLHSYDEVGLEDRGVIWHCVSAVGDPGYRQTFDGQPLVLGAGATCSRSPEILDFGLLAGSACVPRVESLFAFYGLDDTVSTVDIVLTDGRVTRLFPVDGAVLFAWAGSEGLAIITLNDDASAEMVGRVQAEWAKYELAAEPCA